MKYDIKVGYYVETKDGRYGYVTEVTDNGIAWYCKTDCYFYHSYFSDLLKSKKYIRIGKYDITKQNKIQPLPNMDFIGYRNKLVDCEMNQQNVVEMWNKINEIIDYINKED